MPYKNIKRGVSNKMAKVSFCGVSGNGMSPLAQILKLKGDDVYGSDRDFDLDRNPAFQQALTDVGIKIIPQDGSGITKDIETLYVSTAIENNIPDIKRAVEQNIPIVRRFELLAEIFHQYTHNIAIGGTSGKTTTTAMIGYVLDKLGQKPCMINGGILKNYENRKGIANFIYNEGNICIIEADESNGSIEKYHPYIALINNISVDHKQLDELVEIFENFAARAKHAVVINADNEYSNKIRPAHKQVVTFSIQTPRADFFASDIKPVKNGTQYSLDGKTFNLKLIGTFNVSNALACIAVCSLLGIDKCEAAEALESFEGTKRRLEILSVKNDITVIDDFAHNPDKVLASVSALKAYPGRVIVMFQPHGFIPMKLTGRGIMESFAQAMDKEDILLMPEIFTIDGTFDTEISSQMLIDYAKSLGVNARFISDKDAIRKFILNTAKPGDRIVIMGARDITLTDFAKQIMQELP